jgi:MEDS: MEthanogen/methylotroph, DcmR Sensory domain
MAVFFGWGHDSPLGRRCQRMTAIDLRVVRSVVVEFSTALAAQLAALGSSAVQLPDAVEELHGLLLAVVPSALGLSITVHISDVDLTLTTVPEGVQPQTSLRVPLSMWAGFETGSEIVFYASTSGSLVDLAAELGWALELNITWTNQILDHVLVVDQHLTPVPGLSGLDDLSAVNQAVGVLLSRGRSHDVAVEDLRRAATLANSSIGAAAQALMGRLARRPTGHHVDLTALTARARWDGTAGSGDHLCGLYRGEGQRDEIMLPYLRAGLVNGDQCLCLIDRTDPAVIRDRLSADASAVDAPQLDIRSASDVYLANGDFVVEEMIGFLDETAVAVSAIEGDRRFRAAGEMSWATGSSRNFEQFFSYESELNRMTSEHAPALLCLFDLDDLDGPALDNVLRTHPMIVYAHGVIDNPYYRNPDDYPVTC